MKKLLSLLFGACGLLYGVPSQAEVICCPANQQCGDVCCPTKGCNVDKTACATDTCASGLIDYNGQCCDSTYYNALDDYNNCTYCDMVDGYGHCLTCSNGQGYILNDDGNGYRCGSCDSGYYADYNNNGLCAPISYCSDRGGCLKYAYNGGYECYTSAVYDGYYADYNGQCVPTSNCTSIGGCLYNYNYNGGYECDTSAVYNGYYADYNNNGRCAPISYCTERGGCLKYVYNGGYECDTSAVYNGYYADYNGQCVNCSDKGSGYGTYDGYCVYCSDYGYVSDGYGYCVDPLYTCPSGFVPSGYSGDVCCGNDQEFSKYTSISYDGYDHGWLPDAYGWTPPRNNFSACGCPYSECGFYYYGDGYCTNGGYSFTHESEPGLISIGPNTGCPSFSGYNPVYSGPGYEQNICCYMDVDGRPFEAASLAYWLVSAQSCSDFDLFVHPSSRCCPEGYYYDNGICCPDGYYNDDGICKYYW